MKVYVQPPNRPQDRRLVWDGEGPANPKWGWPNAEMLAWQLEIPEDRIIWAGGKRINGEESYLLVVI